MQNHGLHRREICVSAGSIDNGVEFSMQGNRVAADRNSEVRSVRLPIHNNVSESTGIFARRRKDSGNALDRTKVRIAERILASNGCAARVVCLPGSEEAAGVNCSYGLGIHERRIEKEWLSGANLFHLQLADVEL